MTRLSIRIDFEPTGTLGPGMMQLLERVALYGSIRQAAASMTMSYRKAWLLIQAMHETFGGPMVHTATGGAAGGGAQLTQLGMTVVKFYRRIDARAARAVAPELKTLSAMVRENAPARKRRSGKPGGRRLGA